MKNIEKLPKSDYITITYEEFCQHPQETLENIMKRLSQTMIHAIDASSLISSRTAEIDGSVQKLRKHIYHSMKTYFDTFHYSIDE
jgi:hypothetical protein